MKLHLKSDPIQGDGGSELMMEFEEVCRELSIALVVRSLAKPQSNGGVERSNTAFKGEFESDTNEIEDTKCGIRREAT